MDKEALEMYKTFIDDLVKLRPGVLSLWIMGDGWPKTVENEKVNKVLGELSTEQKEVFALIAQSARDGGIHDFLVYLTDQIGIATIVQPLIITLFGKPLEYKFLGLLPNGWLSFIAWAIILVLGLVLVSITKPLENKNTE